MIFDDNQFAFNLEITEEDFANNITTDPSSLDFWSNEFNVPFEDVANVKFAAGYVFGYYGYYNKSGYYFGNDLFFHVPSKGPLEEVTLADQYLIFFKFVSLRLRFLIFQFGFLEVFLVFKN